MTVTSNLNTPSMLFIFSKSSDNSPILAHSRSVALKVANDEIFIVKFILKIIMKKLLNKFLY